MSQLEIGSTLDGFRIDRLLYAGAMAQIFEVSYEDGRTSPFPMVMKVPKLSQGDGGENVTSFEVELQMLEVLRGGCVPRYVAAGDLASPTPYLVIEHLQGQTLESWMESRADASITSYLPELCTVMSSAAQAVHKLHEQNACHLDLKPANLFLTVDRKVVLLDFGLSLHGDYPDLLAEEFRTAIGSPAWISPEQVVGVRGDPRSDIFALGVILYEMVTKEFPFGAPESTSGLRNRLWMSARPPRAIDPSVPPWLQEVILKCLQAKADDRYSSAAMLAFDLRNPSQVAISHLGEQLVGTTLLTKLRRFIWSAGVEYAPSSLPKRTIKEVPIVMVALPDRLVVDSVLWGIERITSRALGNRSGARLAVVTVLRSSSVIETDSDASETALHRQYLTRMQRWAQGVKTEGHQVSFHVLDSDDVAGALLRFAKENYVDLIIMGAQPVSRASGRLIASVPLRVASDATCTVTLVREQLPFEHLGKITEPVTDKVL